MTNSTPAFCPKCGHPITSETQFCPNCGAALHIDAATSNQGPANQATQTQAQTTSTQGQPNIHQTNVNPDDNTKRPLNRMALLGLVIGLISWLLNFWGIVGIIAVVFSILALNQQLTHTEKILAWIGLGSGAFNILYALAFIS